MTKICFSFEKDDILKRMMFTLFKMMLISCVETPCYSETQAFKYIQI